MSHYIPPTPSSPFFNWIRALRITRRPGWFGGVCAGLADRLGMNESLVRLIICIAGLLVGGVGIIVYILAWLILPDQHNRIHLERS